MSFRFYRVSFFALLYIGLAALVALLMCSLASSNMPRLAAKTLFSAALLPLGISSLLNAACGLQHRKMWGRGGLRSYQREEKISFGIDLTVFAAGGLFLSVLSFKTWVLAT